MKIGFIGLGKMGSRMVLNLIDNKQNVVVYNRSTPPIKKLAKKGAILCFSIKEFIKKMPKKKIIWIMVKSGKPVDDFINKLIPFLNKGDIVIDSGNSYFLDSQKRYKELKKHGVDFLDCGTSGGIKGARSGASMMIGGDKPVFKKAEVLFKKMCVKDGYAYVGKTGAGHFVKGVHNAIEYGIIGSIAEGFNFLEKNSKKFNMNLKDISKVYSHGSIISSNLMTLLYEAYNSPKYFKSVSCKVLRGETEYEMKKLKKMSNMKILNEAILLREKSRKNKFCGKIISVLRNKFGGHKVVRKK
jgi:6-phosphogluconate dehydrogenase